MLYPLVPFFGSIIPVEDCSTHCIFKFEMSRYSIFIGNYVSGDKHSWLGNTMQIATNNDDTSRIVGLV